MVKCIIIKGDEMKRRKSGKPVLMTLVIICVLGLLGLNIIKHNETLSNIDGNFYSFFSMIRYTVFDNPIRNFNLMTTDIATAWQLRQENDVLRSQLEATGHLEAMYYELLAETNELKALSDINALYTDYEMINGKVMTRSLESWEQIIVIDIGSDQGVTIDDGVINSKGIIGRVIDVKENQSTVSLLVANNDLSKVAVKIRVSEDTFANGIITGYDSKTALFELSLLETSSSITEGMLVSTSGLGGIFPSGFKVGEVAKVENVPEGIGVKIYVQSSVDFSDITYVSVVKKP